MMSDDLPADASSHESSLPPPIELSGSVAVVTGGASGIGRALAGALLGRGATVVIADVEQAALDAAVDALGARVAAAAGEGGRRRVWGARTDVTDEASVHQLAEVVYARHGVCHLLFNNAGVTSGGGGAPWDQEPNDWRWCFGVNVFGTGICVHEFVPRMLAGGEPGQVVNTSSRDGGIAPVPTASVYAASKAALSCFTESLDANLAQLGALVRASIFYPSGGLLDTGLYNAQRNRPSHLQRVAGGTGRASMSFDELRARVAAATGREPPVADLDDLAELVCDGAARRDFLIAHDLAATEDLLHRRAEAIGRGVAPPLYRLAL
jgi:NAD(P)-dependent dehydrogenase (short-subunit alcohol dehydrogenase family)